MEDILSKIKEYGGNEYDFVLAGQLDMDAVNLFMQAKELERQGKLAELREQGGKALHDALTQTYIHDNNNVSLYEDIPMEQQPAVVEYIASTLYSNYNDLAEEEQKLIKSTIAKNLEYYMSQYRRATEKIEH